MSAAAPPARGLLIVGCGLIGSSLARAARRFDAAARVDVVEHEPDARARAAALGFADRVFETVEAADGAYDLAAICTPPRRIAEAAARTLAATEDGAVVFDVGSVKGPVARAVANRAGAAASRFVPAHPIAGTERSGPEAGFADLFVDRWCILTPDEASAAHASRVEAFWRRCGARVAVMTAEAHDAILAVTSHVPHLVAYALTATAQHDDGVLDADVVRYSAGGFRDFTRIAASNPVMWRDVFLDNREATLDALDRFARRLETLRSAVAASDAAALEDAFRATRAVRAEIVAEGQETAAPDFGRPHETDES